MLLDILRYPDARLRQESQAVTEITDEIRKFCADLSETMIIRDGLGLAAPQVGKPLRIFVLNDNGPVVFINPMPPIVGTEVAEDLEGCLSFPQVFIKLRRPTEATIVAT